MEKGRKEGRKRVINEPRRESGERYNEKETEKRDRYKRFHRVSLIGDINHT